MKLLSTGLAGISLVFGLYGAEAKGIEMFPKSVVDAGSSGGFARRLGESPLWPEGALGKSRQRIRFFIGGHTISSWGISIDERTTGKRVGHFVEHDGRQIVEERSFRVLEADFAELNQLIEVANLWRIYPQFFVSDDTGDTICIDGMTLIFERVDSAGYRYAEANAQCTAGAAQLAVAQKLMEMAKRPDLVALLH